MNSVLKIKVPKLVNLPSPPGEVDRDVFLQWIWAEMTSLGLEGVHEGTLLCDDAVASGIEPQAFIVDSGEAPRDRDWVGELDEVQIELYFSSKEGAEQAQDLLQEITSLDVLGIEDQPDRDWNAEWKASFQGIDVPPFWSVIPPWRQKISSNRKTLVINPGAGFGTGTHETTQLCLEVIGTRANTPGRALDFGSGSGILSIALALLGHEVDAVEIDPMSIDNSRENALANHVENRIHHSTSFPDQETQKYPVIVANILKPVLLEHADALVSRLASPGLLILSGLIEPDLEPVRVKYTEAMHTPPSQVLENGEWRAIVFIKQ
jgi:ribosomal protein L11 methyltransferase